MPLPRYMLVSEAAKLLGLSNMQIINRIKRGKLKAKKLGRQWMVSRTSVQGAINELR